MQARKQGWLSKTVSLTVSEAANSVCYDAQQIHGGMGFIREMPVERYARDGWRVALWGAGSKGVTFLNTVDRGELIGAVVDLNPRKHGKHVAGTGQVVEPPESLVGHGVDAILVANPVYEEEIRQRCSQLGLSPKLVTL